ncbi:uncharacterized protein [Penaeus vannamei]|uniref:uncharacterized protein n=1 Tax=Penaeus vannamei TaxID=6689 RepID=UPI00387F3B70
MGRLTDKIYRTFTRCTVRDIWLMKTEEIESIFKAMSYSDKSQLRNWYQILESIGERPRQNIKRISSAVKCGGGLSSFSPFNSRVRQGCVYAPTLFNTCMDWIMGSAISQSLCGVTLGNVKVTDLDFADDVAILPRSLESLVEALDAFSSEVKPLGLQVSWTKTKIQDFGGLPGEPIQLIRACGEDVEVTESFT